MGKPVDNQVNGGSPNYAASREELVLYENDENKERGNWSGKLDFILSCLGYAVGLGNVWRFPYLCYSNGGGAFLIPYVIMLTFIGLPVFLLELTLGQRSAMGPITLFKNLAPIASGLGYTCWVACALVGIYYNMIIGWSIFYLFASFTSDLPWQYCNNPYNTEYCVNDWDLASCKKDCMNDTVCYYNHGRCWNETEALANNITEDTPLDKRVPATEEYLNRYVLELSPGIDELGGVSWKLCLCLLAAWIVIFLALIKGIKSSGKVVYFTALFPYVVLLILLIRGATLPGAYEGIHFYMVPDMSRLSDIKVWESAAIQIFYSLSIASGGLMTLASYNKFHTNVVRDTLIVCFGNCCTSVFAGFAIFSILGYLAYELDKPVSEVVSGGTGLAFVAYPTIVTKLPVSPLWAILFFFMLFTLGLDSEFAIVENIVTSILDEYPILRKRKTIVVAVVSAIGFILGLPMTTRGGKYVLDLLDYFAAGWPYLFIGLVETLLVAYVYGIHEFYRDIQEILQLNESRWSRFKRFVTWLKGHITFIYMTVTPLILLLILIIAWVSHKGMEYSPDNPYPKYADNIGIAIAAITILLTPTVMIFTFFFKYRHLSIFNRIQAMFRPTVRWNENAMNAEQRDGDSAIFRYTERNGVVTREKRVRRREATFTSSLPRVQPHQHHHYPPYPGMYPHLGADNKAFSGDESSRL